MKIVFMGTPSFAAESLKRLYADGHDICLVMTQPDKPKNRGMKLTQSPVKELALMHGTRVYQPQTLRDGEAARILRELEPELIAVVAYGKLLPAEILALPPKGCINIHGSLLPKYRGSAPVQHAVLNGDNIAGVTSMYMAEAMDAGDMILTKETEIGEEETAGALYDRLAVLGADLLSETIKAIAENRAPRIIQDESKVTYAPPLKKEMAPINWSSCTRDILCHIRGLNPWPVATAEFCGIIFKIFNAEACSKKTSCLPGTIVKADAGGFEVACGDGTITILELQAPGGRRMPASDYLRGHPLCL